MLTQNILYVQHQINHVLIRVYGIIIHTVSFTNNRRVASWKVDGAHVRVVGIHVRRGDYVAAFGHQGLREAPAEYYRAIARLLDAASDIPVRNLL